MKRACENNQGVPKLDRVITLGTLSVASAGLGVGLWLGLGGLAQEAGALASNPGASTEQASNYNGQATDFTIAADLFLGAGVASAIAVALRIPAELNREDY